ncbi:MAG: SprT family zinc-dependent metalloprotease [Candidatus Cloacimonadaceae bacterium]|nr:SprT family zinc-dependent metalloprotease [Candidatus Cloacimonadaceae bacterium]
MQEFNGIPIRILRSRRKTTTVYFKREGILEVRTPLGVSDAAIEAFLHKKSAVILRKYQLFQERLSLKKDYSDGEKILLLGEEIEIRFVDEVAFVWRQTDMLLVNRSYESKITDVLKHWYHAKAEYHILNRARELAKLHGYKPGKLRISKNKRLWGCCTHKNWLSFDYKLVMAPPIVIDYVILHELAHIDHKNHSKEFWDLVESLMPEYRNHLAWLKKNDKHMSI